MIEWIIITSSLLIITTVIWIIYFTTDDVASKDRWRTYSVGCSVIVFIVIQLIYNISIFQCSSK
jgi:hypothetical protein